MSLLSKRLPVLFAPAKKPVTVDPTLPKVTHHELFQLDLLTYYIALQNTPLDRDLPYPPRPYTGRNPPNDEYCLTIAVTQAKKLLRHHWDNPRVRSNVTLNMIRRYYLGDWNDPQLDKKL